MDVRKRMINKFKFSKKEYMVNKNNIKENFIIKTVKLKHIEIYNNKIKLYFYDKNYYQNLSPIDKIIPKKNNNGYYTTYINVKNVNTNNHKDFEVIPKNTAFIQNIFNTTKKYIKQARIYIKTLINTHILLVPLKLIGIHHKNFITKEKKKEIISNGDININNHSLKIGYYTKVYINPKNPNNYRIDTDYLYSK